MLSVLVAMVMVMMGRGQLVIFRFSLRSDEYICGWHMACWFVVYFFSLLFPSECGTQQEEKVLAFYFSFDTFCFFIDGM